MSSPAFLYPGFGSLVVGLLFIIFSKSIGVAFCRLGKSIWKRHEAQHGNDSIEGIQTEMRKTFPAFAPYDEAKAPKTFRILGIVFLIQAVCFFILAMTVKL